jgi:cobyric acid synthase CobQ
MAAKTLMIQGTASHVGKSVLTAALCRLFAQRGIRVAPFKAQNMSNNSFVTPDGKEIGRAQAFQASACRVAPRADFNPVLIKPSGERSAQLIVNGMVAGDLSARDFGLVRREHVGAVQAAFDRLAREFELVVLEGAGSPAEINLREHDVVNMRMAKHARAPVVLVGDIDRGGVFAALVGTLALLDADEQRHVKGFVVNKFRGDRELLEPGLTALRDRTRIECLGVLPHWGDLRVPQEDSLGWDSSFFAGHPTPNPGSPTPDPRLLTIGVADVPYLANFTDLDALAREPDVRLVRLTGQTDVTLDAVILPGTKHTVGGLRFLRERGLDRLLHRVLADGGTIVGLCGGYQMLGRRIRDEDAVESQSRDVEGLGLLDVVTAFARTKVTLQVTGVHHGSGCRIEGYEVHMGRMAVGSAAPLLAVKAAAEADLRPEGAASEDGRIMGTSVHGLFDGSEFRRMFLNRLRAARGWPPMQETEGRSLDDDLDRLAEYVAGHVDLKAIETIVEQGVRDE